MKDPSLLKSENPILFCVAPVLSPSSACWQPNASTPATPSQEQIEESAKKKREAAQRLARAIMNRANPNRQILPKKERKRIQRILKKIIFEELSIMEQEKNEGKPVPYIG